MPLKHTSVSVQGQSLEFLDQWGSKNPLIKKFQIKVCYVSDQPNRNKSIITRAVAKDSIGPSLPGSPIVGLVKDADFSDHGFELEITEDNELVLSEKTMPYGFIDLNADVWFEDFTDDGINTRTYLMTEGWMWVGQYPEVGAILESDKHQSMALDEKTLKGEWAKSLKTDTEFFIINEAIIKNLCLLGDDVEPCFEGARITSIPTNSGNHFSYNDNLFKQFYNLVATEIQKTNVEGGKSMVIKKYELDKTSKAYASLVKEITEKHFSDASFTIKGLFDNEETTFAIVENEDKSEVASITFTVTEDIAELSTREILESTESYEFSEEDADFIKFEIVAPATDPEDTITYSVEDYTAISDALDLAQKDIVVKDTSIADYAVQVETLTTANAALTTANAALTESLSEFNLEKDKVEKEDMLKSFTLLSDEHKKELAENIEKYSVKELKTELSLLYTRKSLEQAKNGEEVLNFSLNSLDQNNSPSAQEEWMAAVITKQETIN